MSQPSSARTAWGGPSATRIGNLAEEVARWCSVRRIRRPFLLVAGNLAVAPDQGPIPAAEILHGIEARGVSARLFENPVTPTVTTVAEVVAAFHFEDCDGLIAIGGGVAMDVAKAVVLMTVQNRPIADFAEGLAAGEPWLDARLDGMPTWLAVPVSPISALLASGAAVIVDELSRALVIRNPALRADLAIVDPRLCRILDAATWAASDTAVAALLAEVDGPTVAETAQREDRLVALIGEAAGALERRVGAVRCLSRILALDLDIGPLAAIAALSRPDGLAVLGVDAVAARRMAERAPGVDPAVLQAAIAAAGPAPDDGREVSRSRRRGGRAARRPA